MKKIYLLIAVSFFISQKSFSQEATPNASFENWTLNSGVTQYYTPDNWDQLNAATNPIGILTCVQSTDAHSGSFACKLITKYVDLGIFKDTANGIISTGDIITIPPYGVIAGIPYTQRPDSIYGWIKYSPAPGDSCQIQFQLFGLNHDTIAKALYKIGDTISSYTRFSVPITYYSAEIPDTSLWLISGSNGYLGLPNTTMWIDDIGLALSVGIEELNFNDLFSVFPNPANDILEIKNDKQVTGGLNFFNAEGKKVKYISIDNQTKAIDVSKLPNGIYVLQFRNNEQTKFASAKIMIQH